MTLQDVCGGYVSSVGVAKVRTHSAGASVYTINHIELTLGSNRLRFLPDPMFFYSEDEAAAAARRIGERLTLQDDLGRAR